MNAKTREDMTVDVVNIMNGERHTVKAHEVRITLPGTDKVILIRHLGDGRVVIEGEQGDGRKFWNPALRADRLLIQE